MEDNTQNAQQHKNNTSLIVPVVVLLIIAIIGGAMLLGSGNNTSTGGTVPTTNNVSAPNAQDTTNLPASSNTYTLAEVSQHDSKDNCWMVVSGQIYDVTSYVNAHPGGRDILKGCGIDATSLYDTQGGYGEHSSSAHKILENFQIGTLTN